MALKVGINGFGRIGRNVLRRWFLEKNESLQFVAINDLAPANMLAHLFRYDSTFGVFPGNVSVSVDNSEFTCDGKTIRVLNLPLQDLPWGELGVDVVIEATGVFTKFGHAQQHLRNGAKKVIVSAPSEGTDITIVLGVNQELYDKEKHHIVSNASCTTNCLAPLVKVLDENFGLEEAFMTTVHAYTSDQRLLDSPHKDYRRARAAGLSMIPTTTGATKALFSVYPPVQGRLNGCAIRVPVPNVSLIDLTARFRKKTTVKEINDSVKLASARLSGILRYVDEPLVGVDFVGDSHSCIFDSLATQSIGDENKESCSFKMIAWYDNESGYASRVLDLSKVLLS